MIKPYGSLAKKNPLSKIPNVSQRFKSYYSPGQSIRFILTEPEEERSLFEMAKELGGDLGPARAFLKEHRVPTYADEPTTARTFLITNHLLFAQTDAKGQIKSAALRMDEIVSAANFAVMKAFESFDTRKGFRFTTYLRHFIRGEIASLWKTKFSGGISDPSICGPSGCGNGEISKEKWDAMSGNAGTEWKNDRNILMSEDHSAEGDDLKGFNREKLGAAMLELSPKDRELMNLHYVEGKGFAEIGRDRGVTREAVRATHARIVKRLRAILKTEGVSDLE